MELLPYVPITLFKHLQDLGRADSTVATIQSDSGKVLPVDRMLAESFCQWKRKLSEPPEPSALLRVQTSEPAKETIEIKLPSGVSIQISASAVDSLSAILKQIA